MMRAMRSPDRTLAAFGRNVARIRSQRGLSQDELAEKADLDRTYVSGIERGVRNPGVKTVLRIARALGVSVGDLCKGVDA
jgi:transcriptional regulator with XRE-family HTH domain